MSFLQKYRFARRHLLLPSYSAWKIGMSQTFNDFLHSTGVDSMPKEILGLGRRWLLDLFGDAAGAIETSM